MAYKMLIAAAALMIASPAFAGGHGHGNASAGLLGGILTPVSTVVSALNVSGLNYALNGNTILSGNQVGILNGTSVGVAVPVNIGGRGGILNGLLGGGLLGGGGGHHGCGCN